MQNKTNWNDEYSKKNFDCGTYMGFGFVNLVFSHLPARVLKVVALVGISADRETGLNYLHTACDMTDVFRCRAATFLVCFYSFYLEQFFGRSLKSCLDVIVLIPIVWHCLWPSRTWRSRHSMGSKNHRPRPWTFPRWCVRSVLLGKITSNQR